MTTEKAAAEEVAARNGAQTDQRKTFYLVFAGLWLNDKGQRRHAFVHIPDDQANGEVAEDLLQQGDQLYGDAVFSWGERMGLANPGCIIAVQAPPEVEKPTTLYPKSASFHRRISDSDRATKWRARYDAKVNALADKKRQETDRSRNLVYEALEPLRQAYRDARPAEKRAMLADFLRFIMS